jgi:glycosyltransferase involved in cell wall biosynthesis
MCKILFHDYHLPFLIKDSEKPVGGATVQLYSWLQGLSKIKQQAGVLTFKGAKKYLNLNVNFDIVETYLKSEGMPALSWFTHRFPSLLRGAKNYKPDFIIRASAGFETGLISLVAKDIKAPFVYRAANDIDADERIKKRINLFSRSLYNLGLKNAKAILCQNQYQYEKFRKKYPAKKMIILHNPFYQNQDITPLKSLQERKYIAWIGIFSAKKNLPLLLEIAENLRDYEFRIAGKTILSTDDKTLQALENLRKMENVKFTGFLKRSEIIPFISEAYCLLNTSHFEGFSNTYLEAFTAGTPVITSVNTDPDGIIMKNKLGYCYSHTNEIKDYLSEFRNENDFNNLVSRCRQYVKENHNPEKLATRLVEFLGTL